MIWIGVSGAHGVGKSTVISGVENILGNKITVVREVARSVMARGFALGKDADTDSYVALVAEYIKARVLARNHRSQVVIFDRTILDTLSYAMVNLTCGQAVPEHVIDLLEAAWLEEKSSFAEYIFVPIEFEEVARDGRVKDESYRQFVSDKITLNLGLSNVAFSELNGNREQRVGQFISIIYRYL
ncbi:MAG: AAA family ATPase [Candidatus Accumulibacter sp.]|uniref:AAA family ATPase n=1 Tax=Candidatus Accumulibacter proximus TaxID=2954385 RepID=A0A935PXY7_9PROT|nr:AAA family ATPase [Candidatus Accumulibacter proximus]